MSLVSPRFDTNFDSARKDPRLRTGTKEFVARDFFLYPQGVRLARRRRA